MPDHPNAARIICLLSHFYDRDYSVVLLGYRPCWSPGIEATDGAAKVATTDGTPLHDQAVATDICLHLYQAPYSWQDKWSDTQTNKL